MRYLILSLIILLGFSIFCDAGTINPNVDDSKYVEYGSQHKCVVKICGEYPNQVVDGKRVGFIASSVIIKPRIVLTAAHVTHEASNIYIELNGVKTKILQTEQVKGYDYNTSSDSDISVCYLEKEVKLDFYPELYEKDDEVGKICSISGYGMTGNYKTGVTFHDGKKRAGSNIIDGICNGMLSCSVNKKPLTSLEFLIANGDSGGGLFINQKLAGINSSIMTHKNGQLNSDMEDESCHTRISIHKEWIEGVILKFENMENSHKGGFDFF
jgi:hypothetical protein